jgi:FtsZ-binding cell division protein ZapB
MSDFEVKGKVTLDDQASKKMESLGKSTKNLIVGFSGLATGAINLVNSYDRVQRAQLQVEKSELAVKRATETLNDTQKKHQELLGETEDLTIDVSDAQEELDRVQGDASSSAITIAKAQEKLNTALGKLAANKADTVGSVKDIAIAEEALRLKTEQAKQAADDQKMAIITGVATAVPSVVTMGDNFVNLMGKIKNTTTETGLLKTSLTNLNGVNFTGLIGSLGKLASALTPINIALAPITAGLMSGYTLEDMFAPKQDVYAFGQKVYSSDKYSAATTGTKNADGSYSSTASSTSQMTSLMLTQLATAKGPQDVANIIRKEMINAGLHSSSLNTVVSDIFSRMKWPSSGESQIMKMIPAFGKGAIVNEPTLALIGERGKEAVVPLDKGGGFGNTIQIIFNGDVFGYEDFESKVVKAVNHGVMRQKSNISF